MAVVRYRQALIQTTRKEYLKLCQAEIFNKLFCFCYIWMRLAYRCASHISANPKKIYIQTGFGRRTVGTDTRRKKKNGICNIALTSPSATWYWSSSIWNFPDCIHHVFFLSWFKQIRALFKTLFCKVEFFSRQNHDLVLQYKLQSLDHGPEMLIFKTQTFSIQSCWRPWIVEGCVIVASFLSISEGAKAS